MVTGTGKGFSSGFPRLFQVLRLLDHNRMNVTRSDSTLWPQVSSPDNTDPLFVVPVSSSNVAGAGVHFHSAELWSARAGYEWDGHTQSRLCRGPTGEQPPLWRRHHYSSSLAHHRQRRQYDSATLVAARISPFICAAGYDDSGRTVGKQEIIDRAATSMGQQTSYEILKLVLGKSQRLNADFRELKLL